MTSLAIMARSRTRDEMPKKQHLGRSKSTLVSACPRNRKQGLLKIGTLTIACALGRSGIGILKREGDGKTPLAAMEILSGFYRKDCWPIMARKTWMLPSNDTLGWCDAPNDRNYNRAIRRPDDASHEKLIRDDGLYDCVIVLDWNKRTRKANRGSAIFLHIARDGYRPTEGCIAISKPDMMRLLQVVKPGDRFKTLL